VWRFLDSLQSQCSFRSLGMTVAERLPSGEDYVNGTFYLLTQAVGRLIIIARNAITDRRCLLGKTWAVVALGTVSRKGACMG
jgi:hypothetical protein